MTSRSTWLLLLALVGVVHVLVTGVVTPLRQAVTAARVHRVVLSVDVLSDAPEASLTNAPRDIGDVLRVHGFSLKNDGWPTCRVIVHEFRLISSGAGGLVRNVELQLRAGPSDREMLWAGSTPLEVAPPGSAFDVSARVDTLLRSFEAATHVRLAAEAPANPRGLS